MMRQQARRLRERFLPLRGEARTKSQISWINQGKRVCRLGCILLLCFGLGKYIGNWNGVDGYGFTDRDLNRTGYLVSDG